MTPRLLPILAGVAFLAIGVNLADLAVSVRDGPSPIRLAPEARAQEEEPASPPVEGEAAPEAAADDAPPPAEGEAEGGAPGELEFSRPVETTDEGVDLPADLTGLTRAEVRLLTDLAGRRDALVERERRMDEREALIQAAEEQILEQQRQLLAIKTEIEALLARYEAGEQEDLNNLIQTYRQMKPRAAAVIWNEMDLETLLPIARGIPPRQVAPIIAAMNPEQARILTRELALREELPQLPQ